MRQDDFYFCYEIFNYCDFFHFILEIHRSPYLLHESLFVSTGSPAQPLLSILKQSLLINLRTPSILGCLLLGKNLVDIFQMKV